MRIAPKADYLKVDPNVHSKDNKFEVVDTSSHLSSCRGARFLPLHTDGAGKYELEVIAYRGNGQILDHAEFLELCEKVDSGEYDLVIAEDLSRICRRMHAVIFCEEAADTTCRGGWRSCGHRKRGLGNRRCICVPQELSFLQ